MSSRNLEISVAVMPEGSTTELSYEMALIRPALLYGDKVKVYSPALNVLEFMDHRHDMNGTEYLELARLKALEIGIESGNVQAYQEIGKTKARTDELRNKTPLTEEELREREELLDLEQRMKRGYETELRPQVEKQLKDAGFNEVRRAVKEGLLEIQPLIDQRSLILDSDGDMIVRSYFNAVSEVVSKPHLFPLLDEFSIKIAQALVEDGVIPEHHLRNRHGKEIHLATELMKLAPSFPRATVWEIIDIRKDLQDPLVRFRAAVLKFGELINAPVFGDEFVVEVQDLIRAEINPALLAIDQQTQDNKYLKRLARSASSNLGTVSASGLSLLVGNGFDVPVFVSAIVASVPGIVASKNFISSAVGDFWAMKDEQKALEQRDLYFVAKMDKTLATRFDQ